MSDNSPSDSAGAPPSILVDEQDGVVSIVLNNAERGNALGPDLVEALTQQIALCTDRDDVHTLALYGSGASFCTGFDWSDVDTASDGDLLLRFVRIELLLQAVWTAPLRTVACVHGRAWGAGADLVAACDVRLAQAATTFRFPGAAFGIVLGTRRLAERIGATQARAIVTSGREIGAPEALRLGLVTGIVEQSGADAVAALPEPRVDRATLAGIARATGAGMEDADLSNLVRSAARGGLGERLRRYRAGLRRAPG